MHEIAGKRAQEKREAGRRGRRREGTLSIYPTPGIPRNLQGLRNHLPYGFRHQDFKL